jgi:uncharacterized membrane protein
VVFDIIGHFTNREPFKQAGWWNLILAAGFAIITVASGLSAKNTLPHNDAMNELLNSHGSLGFISLGLITLLLVWRSLSGGRHPRRFTALYFSLSIIAVGTVMTGGIIGGELVYRHGLGVAPVMSQIPAQSQADINTKGEAPIVSEAKYTCPMHPEIVAGGPGKCPQCGMDLVKIDMAKSDSVGNAK